MTADELRALTAAATPGPWLTEGKNALAADEQGLAILAAMCPLEADAALIVWCRNHADALADLIDAARYIRTTGHGEKLTDMTTCRCGDPHPCPVLRTHDAIADLIDAARAVETAQFSSRPGDLMRAVMGLSDPLTALEAR